MNICTHGYLQFLSAGCSECQALLPTTLASLSSTLIVLSLPFLPPSSSTILRVCVRDSHEGSLENYVKSGTTKNSEMFDWQYPGPSKCHDYASTCLSFNTLTQQCAHV